MNFKNYWLNNRKLDEKTLLKIIEWAHRKDKLIENLTKQDIEEAMKAHLRESSHASF